MPRVDYAKLKTNLRLVVNRLKLLEKKKTELALKARREIADYIQIGKEDRARIRVEHIIREDYLVEAMEMVEMYADLLLARFGLIQSQKELDPGLEEPISSIIWVAPRLQADVPEFREIAEQLMAKYGKDFAEYARANKLETVNEKLMHKLGVQAPSKMLVERYMIEIAKSFDLTFTPDPEVMAQDEVYQGDMLIHLDGFGQPMKPVPPQAALQGGCGACAAGAAMPPPLPFRPPSALPPAPPVGQPGLGFSGAPPPGQPSTGYNGAPPAGPPGVGYGGAAPAAPPYGSGYVSPAMHSYPDDGRSETPAPPYSAVSNGFYQPPAGPPQPSPRPGKDGHGALPDLPAVPSSLPSVPGHGGSNDVDFDDLTKRFEELKKKK